MRNSVEVAEINKIKDRMLKENPGMSKKKIDVMAEKLYYEDQPLKIGKKISGDNGYKYGIDYRIMFKSMGGVFAIIILFLLIMFLILKMMV